MNCKSIEINSLPLIDLRIQKHMSNEIKIKKSRIFLVVLLFVSCQSASEKKELSYEQNPYKIKVEQYFQTLVSLEKFNGAVFIQKEDSIIIFDNFNIDQKDIKSLNTTKSDQFDIHSISKLMAKAAIVDLENEELISRSDLVSKYVLDFPSGNKITIDHLIENQSGLPREFSFEVEKLVDKNPKELIDLIKKEKLLYEPGTESSYSNLGYQLLYYIISKIVNKPFVEFLNEKYFEPLKMTSTGAHFHLQEEKPLHLVQNHELDDNHIVVIPNIQNDDKNQAKLFSNINDLAIFLALIKSPKYSNKLKNKSRNTIGWSGGGDGILSHMEYNIDGNFELIFFSNYDEIPFGDIVLTIEKIMTNQPYELPKAINRNEKPISNETLSKYVGKYRMREFNNSIFEFRIEENVLVFYQDGEKNTVLKAETDSTFFELPTDENYFEFKENIQDDYKLIYHYKKVPIVGKREGKR